MSSISLPLRDRLASAQKTLGLTAAQLAAELRISPEWLSKIMNRRVTGSDDIGLRLDELLRRKGIELSSPKSEASSSAATGPLEYGTADALRREIDQHNAALLIASKEDPARLGWIREQQKAHLAIPKHWVTNEEINRIVHEQRRREREEEEASHPRPHHSPKATRKSA